MGISSPGIGSGLDVNGIVTKLMAVESQPLTALSNQTSTYQAKLSAYGSLSSALSTFQGTLSGLADLSKFQSYIATPSDTTVLTASAAASATVGNYALNITALAQAQSLTAAGQTSTSAAIGSGTPTTLTFAFGTTSGTTFTQDATQATGTVIINSSNNSLLGIRDAINAANIGVTATIVNDGSATPYRLQLTSATGANKSMTITAAGGGDATVSGLLSYNPASVQTMTQSAAAQDAALTVNGLAVLSPSNTVTTAIPGVTLNLAKIGSSSLTIANDTASIQKSVQSFVDAYNSINSTIGKLTSYDPTTQQAGLLLGDFATQSIQTKLANILTTPLTGLGNTSITTLSQLGVSVQKDGSLALDTGKLNTAIANNLPDIAGMFASVGRSTDSLVQYSSSTTATQPGNYAVAVTQLAAQGNQAGNINLNAGITIGAANNTLNLTLDGTSSSVTLTSGTYTAAQLAALVQSSINGNAAFSGAGSKVSVAINSTSGFMTITSSRYGSASNVTVANSSAGAALIGATTSTAGLDVAGTINGVAAGGSGQYLTGAIGSTTEGLKLLISGGAVGSRGTINFSSGYANNLNNYITAALNGGTISAQTDGINQSLTDLAKQTTDTKARLVTIEAGYRAQFTALDVLMGQLQTTSTYLTQQLAAISSNTPK
ncbi:MAG: flagellar hook protein FliD [Candidimonas sp.]|nr:MAG: flagellar hook protein FliD [Candidimonas sp.]